MLDVEAAIAVAARIRGHDVHAVICDGVAKACVKREITVDPDIEKWSEECASCRKSCENKLKFFNLDYSVFGDHISPARVEELRSIAGTVEWKDLPSFEFEGVKVGPSIRSSILRYLRGMDFNGDARLLREYVFAGLVALVAANNSYTREKATNVFMSHGIYVDWGPALRSAIDRGLKMTCWMGSYLHAAFYFRHPKDYVNLDFHNIDESTWIKEKSPLSEVEARRLDHYLVNRYVKGKTFDVKELKSYGSVSEEFRRKFVFNNGKKTWAIFAHVNWDCVTDYAPMLFDDFNQWIASTISALENDDSVNWLLKVHPAEAWDNPATGVQAMVKERFQKLPDHIRIVGFDEDINPLVFYGLIDGAVTVYGTPGLEMAYLGKPVIMAGRAHYAGKGFTYDPGTREEYYELLHSARDVGPISTEKQDLAKRYSYIYFVQRQVPFPPVVNRRASKESNFWEFNIRSRNLLIPGGDRYVDFIVDRMIDDNEFLLPRDLEPVEQLQ
ncbi:MAG TPA: hypothetical protein VHB46_12220 [Burkholderiales bacterium]|nr:hypothetical protein [Burkholderiales bacterium]